ncbi:MAG: diaminopimelate epimerase, partial [Flavobacteriales bacterium]
MQIAFSKYHGTGNDFIMIDGRSLQFDVSTAVVQRLCDRHFGIGSDGLLILRSASDADFYADFYNPDGSQSFCGNGSRCAIAFAFSLGLHPGHGTFTAFDGKHVFKSVGGEIAISMRVPDAMEQRQLDIIMNTGSPHFIHPVEVVEAFDLKSYTHGIRYSDE